MASGPAATFGQSHRGAGFSLGLPPVPPRKGPFAYSRANESRPDAIGSATGIPPWQRSAGLEQGKRQTRSSSQNREVSIGYADWESQEVNQPVST